MVDRRGVVIASANIDGWENARSSFMKAWKELKRTASQTFNRGESSRQGGDTAPPITDEMRRQANDARVVKRSDSTPSLRRRMSDMVLRRSGHSEINRDTAPPITDEMRRRLNDARAMSDREKPASLLDVNAPISLDEAKQLYDKDIALLRERFDSKKDAVLNRTNGTNETFNERFDRINGMAMEEFDKHEQKIAVNPSYKDDIYTVLQYYLKRLKDDVDKLMK
jgi:hypothetical protein